MTCLPSWLRWRLLNMTLWQSLRHPYHPRRFLCHYSPTHTPAISNTKFEGNCWVSRGCSQTFLHAHKIEVSLPWGCTWYRLYHWNLAHNLFYDVMGWVQMNCFWVCNENRVTGIHPVWDPRVNIDFSQKNSKVPRVPVESTHNNSGNTYQNWVKLNNMGPSNRARALLGLM